MLQHCCQKQLKSRMISHGTKSEKKIAVSADVDHKVITIIEDSLCHN